MLPLGADSKQVLFKLIYVTAHILSKANMQPVISRQQTCTDAATAKSSLWSWRAPFPLTSNGKSEREISQKEWERKKKGWGKKILCVFSCTYSHGRMPGSLQTFHILAPSS